MSFAKQAYPYCIHGKYVGGCGVDLMCFACEMGDEPTPEEYARYKKDAKAWYAEQETEEGRERQFWSLPDSILEGP